MAAKEIKYGAKAREKMMKGVDAMADVVMVTFGPNGRNVLINQSWGTPKLTKDGVTVAKEIELEDRFKNMGAQMVKEAASATSDAAGDGYHHGNHSGPGHLSRGRQAHSRRV